MTDYLFVRLGASGPDAATVVLNAEGRVVEPVRRARLDAIASRTEGRRVIVLAPATETVTTRADLPKASQARLRQLLPYSLEETFAEDVETLHFAAGPRLATGKLAVSVVARERLEAWLAALAAAGIRPHALYSEADGVPDTPSTLNLLIEGATVYGRRPGEAPFVLEGMNLGDVLDLLGAQSSGDGTDLQHVLVYLDADGAERRMPELAEIHTRVADLDVKELTGGVLPRLAATLVFEPGANLLQGPYAPKSDYAPLFRPWYAAAGLLLAWAVLTVGTAAVQYVALAREDRALAEQIGALCARSFGASSVSACTADMRARLASAGAQASGGGESFLSTLAVIAATQSSETRIEALSYRNSVMDLQLVVPSVPELDAFAQEIEDTARFDVRIQQATPQEAGVEGRVQVVAARP